MMPVVTILTCKACGIQDTPRLDVGSGPHAARVVCAHCGAFVKWLGKPKTQEIRAMDSVNTVVLVGNFERDPTIRYEGDTLVSAKAHVGFQDRNWSSLT